MTQKKVAVILAGCGVYDGAEIQESVLTLLALSQAGAAVQCFAPDIPQSHVVNHLTGEEMPETRNVLVEAARIARGQIQPVSTANASEFDALILPGGFGVAKNLSSFAQKGAACEVEPSVLAFCQAMAAQKKPIGLICIAPALAAKIYGEGVQCTIGTDEGTAAVVENMGAHHVPCGVGEIVVDEARKLVTTPAYMLGQSVAEVNTGIQALVEAVLVRA